MKYSAVLDYARSCPYYIRFTCEKCGCRTHWISSEITVNERYEYGQSYDKAYADRRAAADLDRHMAETIERLKRELNECCAGKRMLTGELSELSGGVYTYFGEAQCPRCKEVQSWAPRAAPGWTKKKQQKNADEFNATPVLSRPDVVIGGEMPEPDAPDFAAPCRLEIHGTSFGLPHASPVYLNGIKIGETVQNSIDISAETYYRDNRIMVYKPMWTSYIEAEEGKTLDLEYRNSVIRRKK